MRYVLNHGYELETVEDMVNNNDDVLLIDNNCNRIIVLNATCAYIVNEFKIARSIEKVVDDAVLKFNEDREVIGRDINEVIEVLVEQEILCEVLSE